MHKHARESTVSPFWPSRSASCLFPKRLVLIVEAPRAYLRSAPCLFRKRLVLISEAPRAYSRSAPCLFRKRKALISEAHAQSRFPPAFGKLPPALLVIRELFFPTVSFFFRLSSPVLYGAIISHPRRHPRHPLHPRLSSIPVFPPSPSFLHPLFQSLLPFVSISPFPLSFSRARIYYIMCNHSALPVSAKKVCTFFVSLWKSRTFASAIEGSRLARRWPSYDALLRERVL